MRRDEIESLAVGDVVGERYCGTVVNPRRIVGIVAHGVHLAASDVLKARAPTVAATYVSHRTLSKFRIVSRSGTAAARVKGEDDGVR